MSISRSNSGVGSFIASNSSANQQVEIQLLKSREFVGPDLFQQSPGLARYRSAPSSFLGALLDPPPDVNSSGDESEALYSAIWTGPLDLNHKGSDDDMQFQTKQGISGYEITPPGGGGGSVVGSYTLGMENQVQVSMSTGNRIAGSTNLVRQSSSPAGVFNGFAVKGEELGNYRSKSVVSGVSSNHLNYSPCPSSSLRVMPSIPENRSMEDQQSRNGTSREFEASLSQGSWSESLFSDLKRDHDGNLKMFTAYNQSQSEETEKSLRPSLTHHLSLPKTFSNDNGDTEKLKFLQFQREVVPCQIRAKRGCATHPRSIAERMRRTRISEKMKKLQELFPNMDKQTSTADMLDLAVRYIKDLQMQVQTLKETKAKCICSLKST